MLLTASRIQLGILFQESGSSFIKGCSFSKIFYEREISWKLPS